MFSSINSNSLNWFMVDVALCLLAAYGLIVMVSKTVNNLTSRKVEYIIENPNGISGYFEATYNEGISTFMYPGISIGKMSNVSISAINESIYIGRSNLKKKDIISFRMKGQFKLMCKCLGTMRTGTTISIYIDNKLIYKSHEPIITEAGITKKGNTNFEFESLILEKGKNHWLKKGDVNK